MKAFIDFFGVTFRVSDNPASIQSWIKHVIGLWIGEDVGITDTGHGLHGYKNCLEVEGAGFVCYGGNNNTVFFELTGTGCALVKDWEDIASTVEDYRGKIKRVDLAHDDFEGKNFNFQWAQSAFHSGGFKPNRGLSPESYSINDEGSKKGSSYYVGSRKSGKMFRGYEKGRQLGDPDSPWFRVEVELRDSHRELTADILRNPGDYLAGAYKCLSDISDNQSIIKTVAFTHTAVLDKSIAYVKRQGGKMIHAMLCLTGGDYKEVVSCLHRPELPKRLAGVIRALLSAQSSMQAGTKERPPSFMRSAHPADVVRLKKVHLLDTFWWRTNAVPVNPVFLSRSVLT